VQKAGNARTPLHVATCPDKPATHNFSFFMFYFREGGAFHHMMTLQLTIDAYTPYTARHCPFQPRHSSV
jgi:hypothetical protein